MFIFCQVQVGFGLGLVWMVLFDLGQLLFLVGGMWCGVEIGIFDQYLVCVIGVQVYDVMYDFGWFMVFFYCQQGILGIDVGQVVVVILCFVVQYLGYVVCLLVVYLLVGFVDLGQFVECYVVGVVVVFVDLVVY